jgi:hypothetical protein
MRSKMFVDAPGERRPPRTDADTVLRRGVAAGDHVSGAQPSHDLVRAESTVGLTPTHCQAIDLSESERPALPPSPTGIGRRTCGRVSPASLESSARKQPGSRRSSGGDYGQGA